MQKNFGNTQRDYNDDSEQVIRQALGIRYSFSDFFDDFQSCGRITKPDEAGKDCQPELLEYFQNRYGDEALDKMVRCLAAASYWEKNKEAFNIGSISVAGDVSLIRGHFISELWIRWCRDDCDWKTYNPPVSEIILACNAIDKQMRDA
jgi:hypothetical protein